MSAFFVLVLFIETTSIAYAGSVFYKETEQKNSEPSVSETTLEQSDDDPKGEQSESKWGGVLPFDYAQDKPSPLSRTVLSANNCSNNQLSPAISATVKWVYDGDTLLLTNKQKIRIIGIDTPETKHHKQKAEAYGAKAREALRALLKKHRYKIQLRYGKEKYDRYKRTLAHVYLPDGTNISNWLLEQGYAKGLAYPPNILLADCYRQSEARAQAKSLRIWKYKKNKLKSAKTLPLKTKSYVRLEGKVTGIFIKRKSITIQLESDSKHHIQLKIKKKNFAYFKSYNTNKLLNKTITVSGILRKKHNKRIIYLNHPSQISINQMIVTTVKKEKQGKSSDTPILRWNSNNDSENKN